MMTNIDYQSAAIPISDLFQVLSVAPRLEILLTIGNSTAGEACVCHLETALGYRQAYISQHLMALREANLVETRREGRYIFNRLADPRILDVLYLVAAIIGQAIEPTPIVLTNCNCPNCNTAS